MVVFVSIIVIILIGIVLMALRDNKDNASYREKVKHMQHLYDAALKGKDRKAALEAGRSYYSIARKGGAPTLYDEQAMANDLSTMPVEVCFAQPSVEPARDSIIPANMSSH